MFFIDKYIPKSINDILDKEEKGIVCFQTKQPNKENSTLIYDGRPLFDHHNYQYIKGDLLDYFGYIYDLFLDIFSK